MHIHTQAVKGLHAPRAGAGAGAGAVSATGVLGGDRAGLGGASLGTIGSSSCSLDNAAAPTSPAATARLRRSGPSVNVWGALKKHQPKNVCLWLLGVDGREFIESR